MMISNPRQHRSPRHRLFPFSAIPRARADRRCAALKIMVKPGKLMTPIEPLSLSLKATSAHSGAISLLAAVLAPPHRDR
jgi:hypothetical protein